MLTAAIIAIVECSSPESLLQINANHLVINTSIRADVEQGTNANDKPPLVTLDETKINSSDPPLTPISAAYATPPLPALTHPPIELTAC